MVHELLGIQNGRVDLSLVPDIRSELSVSLLSASCFTPWLTSLYPGNNINDIHGPILPGAPSCHLWRPRDVIEELCPVLSVAIACTIPYIDKFHFGYETICGGVS